MLLTSTSAESPLIRCPIRQTPQARFQPPIAFIYGEPLLSNEKLHPHSPRCLSPLTPLRCPCADKPRKPLKCLCSTLTILTGFTLLATVETIMSPTLISTLTLLFVSFAHNANASWRMDSATLLTARMDPLVSPNAVASVSFFSFFRYTPPSQFSC